jgi:hypothetical protein
MAENTPRVMNSSSPFRMYTEAQSKVSHFKACLVSRVLRKEAHTHMTQVQTAFSNTHTHGDRYIKGTQYFSNAEHRAKHLLLSRRRKRREKLDIAQMIVFLQSSVCDQSGVE